MSKFKFELNEAGVKELLQGSAMQGVIREVCNTVAASASSAGGEYEVTVQVGQKRTVGRVAAADREARKRNSESNVLLKAAGV